MSGVTLYALTVLLGAVAYWNTGLLYPWIHVNGFTGRLETPDPVDCPLFLAYMLTPLPGLTALADFLYETWGRMA